MNDSDMITAFAAHQRVRGFSERTIDRRTWSLTKLAAAGPFAAHTPASIELFLSRWPSAQSRYSIRSDCHQFYRWAIRRGLLEHDPTIDVDPPRLPARAATPITATQLHHAIDLASSQQRIAVMLAAYAGLRCSEIAHLDTDDVHRDRAVIVVRGGKGGSDSIVPLAPELADVLPLTGPAVMYPNGQAVGAAIRRLFRRAGIAARPHDLRHTFGTAVAVRCNGNVWTVARLMRHSSISTAQRYVRWVPDGAEMVAGLHAA